VHNEPTYWHRELRRGLEASKQGDFSRALSHFERAHRSAPERAETCLALGRERWRRGELHEAEDLLRRAVASADNFLSARLALARFCALERKSFAEAHALLESAPRQDLVTLVRAEILIEEERWTEVEELVAPLRASGDPQTREGADLVQARVENWRGLALVDQGAHEAAVFAFKRASDLDPSWGTPLSNLGAALETLGNKKRAEEAYRKATELQPDYATAWFNLARLQAAHSPQSARTSYQRAHDSAPQDPELAVAVARFLAEDSPIEARSVLEANAIARGDHERAWLELSERLAANHELDLAEDCLRSAYRRSSSAETRRKLAVLLAQKGQWPQAIQLTLEKPDRNG
jgi:superkiller protein 3